MRGTLVRRGPKRSPFATIAILLLIHLFLAVQAGGFQHQDSDKEASRRPPPRFPDNTPFCTGRIPHETQTLMT